MKKVFFSGVILLSLVFQNSFSQNVYMGKTLPQPEFYLIGVDDLSFPLYAGNYDDTAQLAAYGLRIQKWLSEHKNFYESKLSNPVATEIFTYQDFAKLDNEARAIFKKIIAQYAHTLRGQKKILMDKFNIENPEQKGGTTKTFINDAVQVYFLNKKEIVRLKSELMK